MSLARTNATRSAARITIIYTVISAIWIAASDRAVDWLIQDPAMRIRAETLKGWFFVAITAVLLSWALRSEFARTARAVAARERYQALAENARDIMLFLRERDGQILEANRAAVQAYGYSRAELLQKTIYDLRARHTAASIPGQMETAARSGTLFETEHRRADGTVFAVEVSASGVRVGDDHVLVSMIREISERKAAEQRQRQLAAERDRLLARLNLIMDRMPIACILSDAEARVTYWNPAAEAVFGFSSQEMLGKTQFGVIIPAPSESLVREIFRRLIAGQSVSSVVNENTTKDGRTIICEWHNVALSEPDGRQVGYLAMVVDVTARLQAEEEIRRLNADLERRVELRTTELQAANDRLRLVSDELRRLNQVKSEFVSNVSHELRTPLTNIKLYLSLFRDGRPEKRDQYLKTVERETALLQSLIEDLLDLSRLDMGTARINWTAVNLPELLEALTRDRRKLVEGKGLELVVDLPDDAASRDRPVVSADPRMLTQVFSNLLTNAMNYTPAPGRITIRVTHCPDETGRRWAACSVADTGPGIADEDRPHLFERFYRGTAAVTTGAPGTGLGLAICDEIARRHGGRITVESPPSRGSTFTVWLPLLTARPPS